MNWIHFMPSGRGGSFGRTDMGVFCEINTVLFVLPLSEASISKVSTDEIEAKIEDCLRQARPGEIYEWYDNSFTNQPNIDWRQKLRQSIIAQ